MAFGNGSEPTYSSSPVEVPRIMLKKALVYGEVQEIAQVTSYDFWRTTGKEDGWKSEGEWQWSVGNTTLRQRAVWCEEEQ